MTSRTIKASAQPLKGSYAPPGDKSLSHRAVMFGSLSEGISTYKGFLASEDCLHTLAAFQKMGVNAALEGDVLKVHGVGLQGLSEPNEELYLGNSGTSIRLILGILAGQRFEAILSGDPSLSSRPMKRVTEPLKQMGAQIKGKDNGNFAPLRIRGGKLKGIDYENHLGSAQVKSALLFAGLYADGKTRIHDMLRSRDHSERFLLSSGASLLVKDDWIEISRTEKLIGLNGQIPGDISSAAFFIAAAAMTPGSELTVKNVCLNPTRMGILNVLKKMGAHFEIEQSGVIPEPYGTLKVFGGRLKGTRIEKMEIPAVIDELPVIMVLMALAEGESIISGAEELRVKETDRIASMTKNLNAAGARVEELPDGCIIRGIASLKGGHAESFFDHRTVMSMAIASLRMEGDLHIDETACVSTSYPSFFSDFERLTGSTIL